MSSVTVYSKLGAAHQFKNPANGRGIVILGTNSHTVGTFDNQPKANVIAADDWEFIKTQYKDYPVYFDKLKGDSLFVAADLKAATDISLSGANQVEDLNILTKTPKLEKLKDKE